MSEAPPLNGQVVAVAANATRALLDRELVRAETTFRQWVVLNATAVAGGSIERDQLITAMTGALKVDASVVTDTITELLDAALFTAASPTTLVLTEAGRARQARIRTASAQITERLYDGLARDDLAIAARVLTEITSRANAELARA